MLQTLWESSLELEGLHKEVLDLPCSLGIIVVCRTHSKAQYWRYYQVRDWRNQKQSIESSNTLSRNNRDQTPFLVKWEDS